MGRFAIIDHGRVVNIALADAPMGSEWVTLEGVSPEPGIGWTFDQGAFTPPPAPPVLRWTDAHLAPEYHWIDVGPFFDRFGLKALAVTSSTDAQVQGLVTLILPRKYVDLKRADLSPMLDILVAKGIITTAEKASIINPVTTEYERHIKGLAQPQ